MYFLPVDLHYTYQCRPFAICNKLPYCRHFFQHKIVYSKKYLFTLKIMEKKVQAILLYRKTDMSFVVKMMFKIKSCDFLRLNKNDILYSCDNNVFV